LGGAFPRTVAIAIDVDAAEENPLIPGVHRAVAVVIVEDGAAEAGQEQPPLERLAEHRAFAFSTAHHPLATHDLMRLGLRGMGRMSTKMWSKPLGGSDHSLRQIR